MPWPRTPLQEPPLPCARRWTTPPRRCARRLYWGCACARRRSRSLRWQRQLEDDDSLCATLAADALVALGSEAVDALIEILESGNFPAQVQAARALAEIGDPRAIPALFAAGEQGSSLLDYWVSIGFEKMGVGTVYFKP